MEMINIKTGGCMVKTRIYTVVHVYIFQVKLSKNFKAVPQFLKRQLACKFPWIR